MSAKTYYVPTYYLAIIGLALLVAGLATYALASPNSLTCTFSNLFAGNPVGTCMSNPLGNALFRSGTLALSGATLIGVAAYTAEAAVRRDLYSFATGLIIFILTAIAAFGLVKV